MEGRDPLAPIPLRRRGPSEASPIIIYGERLTARQALERYPQLRGYLQPERRLSERALHARLRGEFRNGRIPDHILNEDPPEFFSPFTRTLRANWRGRTLKRAKTSRRLTGARGTITALCRALTPPKAARSNIPRRRTRRMFLNTS